MAGFEPIDRDKFTIKWKLYTLFCDVTIYENTSCRETIYTLAGISHHDDRVVVTSLEMLHKAAELLVADTVAVERIGKALPFDTAIADGKDIKADTWYKLENGKLVEAEE